MPVWFDDAKLGLFIFWNAAAIPAFAPSARSFTDMPDDPEGVKRLRRLPFAEMYQNALNIPGSLTARYHAQHYGDLSYDAFVAQFRDDLIPAWDPGPVADLCVRAGGRYVVMFTKMEDGFLPWPSSHPNPHRTGWQSERDIIGELATAVRARGLRYGLGYCGGIDWTFEGLPFTDRASRIAALPQGDEYRAYVDAHWRELIERYQPAVLWNDMGYPGGPHVDQLFHWFREQVPDGVINNRFHYDGLNPLDLFPSTDFITPEYTTEGNFAAKWETCRGVGTSFGYNRREGDADYLSAAELIHMFVDVVARGGNLLLGIGLTANGDVPWIQAERLLALGWWLRINGGAIYGTRPWERTTGVTGDSLEVRYTASDDAVHAIILGTPMDLGTPTAAAVDIDVRLDEGTEVSLEGRAGLLSWTPTPAGVQIKLPEAPDPQPAISLRLSPRHGVHPFRET